MDTNLSWEQKVDLLLLKVNKIEDVLCGDSKFNTLGLIERQDRDEARLKDLEFRVHQLEVISDNKKLKTDTIFIVLRNTLYGLLILLTGFLIIKGVVDWEKLFDILK